MLGFQDDERLGERIQAVHRALGAGEPYDRWLLIFDGAEDADRIESLLPQGSGHVLITTTTTDWVTRGFSETLIEPFTQPESVAYTLRRVPRLSAHEARQLAEAMENLPLALAQTAAYLGMNPTMAVAAYIEEIREGARLGHSTDSDYENSFEVGWAKALNSLRDKHPDAYELLHVFAFFSPHAIPVRLIQTAHPADLPPYLARLAEDPARWNSAIRRLAESTAVQLDHEDFGEGDDGPVCRIVVMHRYYHKFLVSVLPPDTRKSLSDVACRVLAGADPRHPASSDAWKRYDELVPHLEHAGALSSSLPAVRRLVLNCAQYLRLSGDPAAGAQLLETATPG
ncbi:hypothetical protein [Streptomyces sp. NPDC056165]|uniref:hypothetical protein n=1 Tax=Streptomyces sp. NPDC056165 TaxID=3345733 RepID=UPI0035E175DB